MKITLPLNYFYIAHTYFNQIKATVMGTTCTVVYLILIFICTTKKMFEKLLDMYPFDIVEFLIRK